MASKVSLALSVILVVTLSYIWASREKKMVLYAHDILSGPNVTAVTVAGMKGVSSSPLGFGTILIFDDLVTEGPEISSTVVGRAQGMYFNSHVEGASIHVSFSIVFQSGEYNGSSLEIQGPDPFYVDKREVSVVGGTGTFRYARGYAILETESMVGFNATLKLSLTVRMS